MTAGQRSIAFYAPMKAPAHPVPSGDRQIARLTLAALDQAGFDAKVVSDLRIFDKAGDQDVQQDLQSQARAEIARLIADLQDAPPALWFTYHCHYKAPDLIGPHVARALQVPYVISEPSLSPRRREGPWAAFAAASENAIAAADHLFWTTERDRPALVDAGHTAKMTKLPAFLDIGAAPDPFAARDPLNLLTVAMMRPGDKLESYRRLAAALIHVPRDWHLDIIGDGPDRHQVERLFAPHAARVRFHGAIDDPGALRDAYVKADLLVWPGVGEGVGMVYLEAQAAGLPVIAEDHASQRDIIVTPLATADRPMEFADLIIQVADDRALHAATARAHVERRHSLQAASRRLSDRLGTMIQ